MKTRKLSICLNMNGSWGYYVEEVEREIYHLYVESRKAN